jgi:hypothetical protein
MWKKVAASVTRRRFLAAGGAVTAWALLGGPGEIVNAEVGTQVDEYSLRVDYSERELGLLGCAPGPTTPVFPGL